MFKWLFDYYMYWSHSVDTLKEAHKKDLKALQQHVQDLEEEVKQLKKRRVCYVCGCQDEPLREFGEHMRTYSGFPSYFYCANNLKCVHTYIDQLEGTNKVID